MVLSNSSRNVSVLFHRMPHQSYFQTMHFHTGFMTISQRLIKYYLRGGQEAYVAFDELMNHNSQLTRQREGKNGFFYASMDVGHQKQMIDEFVTLLCDARHK